MEWVQIDEPALALDLPDEWRLAYLNAYERLAGPRKLLLTTYFGSVAHQRDIITSLKVDGLHLDLVAAPEQLETLVPPAGPVGHLGRGHQRSQRLACQPGQAGTDSKIAEG